MTVRVATLKHAAAGRYYTEGLGSYYLDGGEPPGRWFGRSATMLGLDGELDAEAFLAVMAGLHPETGERLGRRFGEGSVRGFDATFSAPKSVSVLFGIGNDTLRGEVAAAHDRSVDAVLRWVESQAHTRVRVRGHVVCVDVEGIVVGVFRQHTSRRLDPQLHSHAVIANRVRSPDGRWLALDARTLKLDQRTLSALYHATLRTELTRRLGVAWREPVNGIAEIEGINPDVLAVFSQRTADIDGRLHTSWSGFAATWGGSQRGGSGGGSNAKPSSTADPPKTTTNTPRVSSTASGATASPVSVWNPETSSPACSTAGSVVSVSTNKGRRRW